LTPRCAKVQTSANINQQLRTSQPSILAIQVGHVSNLPVVQMINTAAHLEFLSVRT